MALRLAAFLNLLVNFSCNFLNGFAIKLFFYLQEY